MRIVNVRRRSIAGAVLSLVALVPVAPARADGGPLSLAAVLERVRERNVSIRSAKTSVIAADGQVQKAWTAWQPNVQAVGQLQFNSVEAKFDSSQIVVGVAQSLGPAFGLTPETVAGIVANLQANAPEPTVIQPIVSLVGQLSAKQLLFNINAVRGPGVAEKGREATLGVVQATEDELTFAAAQLFVSINGLRSLEAAAQRASQVADRRIQDAKAQLEAGTATRLAVTRAETDKATSEGQILALRAQQTGLLASLRGLMGATEEAVELVNAPLDQQLKIELPAVQETRSKVRARELALAAAQASQTLSEQQWLPTLNAEGVVRYANVQGFQGTNVIGQATINLVIPLYDQGVRYADHKIAAAQVESARLALEAEKEAARTALVEAESQLESAKAELAQAEAQLRLATEAVQQIESLVQNGLGTNLELTDADGRRFQADQAVAGKRLQVELGTVRLLYARGGRLGSEVVQR